MPTSRTSAPARAAATARRACSTAEPTSPRSIAIARVTSTTASSYGDHSCGRQRRVLDESELMLPGARRPDQPQTTAQQLEAATPPRRRPRSPTGSRHEPTARRRASAQPRCAKSESGCRSELRATARSGFNSGSTGSKRSAPRRPERRSAAPGGTFAPAVTNGDGGSDQCGESRTRGRFIRCMRPRCGRVNRHRAAICGRVSSAADGVAERAASLRDSGCRQRGHAPTERRSRDRVDVVEVHDTVGGHSIVRGSEQQLRDEPAPGSRQRRHDD